MNINRLRPSRLTAISLILSQALGLSSWNSAALAQTPNTATRPALPTPVSPSTLIGLDLPPQIAPPPPKGNAPGSAVSNNASSSNVDSKAALTDLIQLYQEAAFSDPVLNAARFNYQANKELYWQGLSLLLPQANATPTGTRYYQHGTSTTVVAAGPGNSRVFDQKAIPLP